VHVVNELVAGGPYIPATEYYYPQILQGLREAGKKVLADANSLVRQQDVACETVLDERTSGHAADGIIDQAKQWWRCRPSMATLRSWRR
jgi:hypothetical protein